MTLSELQALPDDALVERVAVEVMVWTRRTCDNPKHGGYRWECWVDGWTQEAEDLARCPWWIDRRRVRAIKQYSNGPEPWNPLTDWGHWRETEERIMNDPDYWERFMLEFEEDIASYMESGLRTRCLAALLAVSRSEG
jgi:hypothetical protein